MKRLRIIALTLCFCMMVSLFSPVYAITQDSGKQDNKFQEALNFMNAFSIMGTTAQKKDVSLITRAEFASWILNILGVIEQKEDSNSNDNKFLGYTNDPEFDENGDWIWNKGSDDITQENLTEFHDVASTHPLYKEIQLITNSGYMSGAGGYFRPDEPITGYELIKVAVEIAGAKELTGGRYPEGYIQQATYMDLLKYAGQIGSYPISYRDAVVILYSTLNTNIYEYEFIGSNRFNVRQSEDITVLEATRGIKSKEGVVTKNNITGIDSTENVSEQYIQIDNMYYYCNSFEYADLLGYKVRVYYKENDGNNDVVTILPLMTNVTKTISSDDDPEYKAPYLYYTQETGKRKKVYIGAETNIIYNGVYISQYDDSIFDITDSDNIILLDNKNDGEYETVFVNQLEYVKVSAVDTDAEKIYNGLNNGVAPLELKDYETKIYDKDFNPMSLENVIKDTIIAYQKTLPTQKKKNLKIICSTELLTGTVQKIDTTNQAITIDGVKYKVVKDFDFSLIYGGNNYIFYLTHDNRIVEMKSSGTLQYAYLKKIVGEFDTDGAYWAKIYDVESQEMKQLKLSDKIKINKQRQKLENLHSNQYLFESGNSKCTPQVIKYNVDEEGNLSEILTANFDKELFTCVEINKPGDNQYYNNWLTYKGGGGFFGGDNPVAYSQSGTRYINLPLTQLDNDNAYFRITYSDNSMGGHSYPDYIFKSKEDSAFVELLVDFTDVVLNGEPGDAGGILMVEDIHMAFKNQEICYYINVFTAGGSMQGEVYNTDLFPIAKQIKKGDIIRWEKAGKRQEIVKLKKVFDGQTKKMTTTKSPYGVNFTNAPLYYYHGIVEDITDNGMMIWTKPYTYSSEGSDIVYGLTGSEKTHILNASKYSVYIFDGKQAYKAFYDTDIFSQEATLNGSQIVTDSSYGSPRCIFIYK